jgi:hypothetical protein
MSLAPKVDWYSFGSADCLKTALGLSPVPLQSDDESFVQLRYLERYASDLECGCFAIESPYIDRDYIEDHSAFYSKNLFPYPNSCRRVHFFKGDVGVIGKALTDAIRVGETSGIAAYRAACKQLSSDHYLGFSVIKPLDGTPVGRTVMKCFPSTPTKSNYQRRFTCTKDYVTHFHGCELTVNGLAFQQQDIGVSACATTALWSALQKASDAEPIASMTPVQITQLATQYSLPSGRPMPSEGLDVGQMCNAVQASGASPNLFVVLNRHAQARYILRAAILSGFAPVLAIRHATFGGHAVVAVGLKELEISKPDDVHFHENSVAGLYIHDDRLGPNLRCTYEVPTKANESLRLKIGLRDSATVEDWELLYILVPMHPKIRLSFANIEQLSSSLVPILLGLHKNFIDGKHPIASGPIGFDVRILRGHKYIEELIVESNGINAGHIERISRKVAPARYLAIVRVSGPFFSQFDLVIDSTGTITNPHFLAVVPTAAAPPGLKIIAKFIAEKFIKCPFVE